MNMQIIVQMKVSDLSERALISHITSLTGRSGKNIVLGAGEDDCAVLDAGGNDYFLITTDMLHRKTDFPESMTGWQIGWMSVAVNLSDLAAKGARPCGLVIAMGIPPGTELSFIEEMIQGMNECTRKYGTQIIGGDIDSHDELTITGTAVGTVKKELLIRRSGAKPGDFVCVTGYPGKAGAALHALESKKPVENGLLKALFEPIPRIKEGMALAKTGSVSSMMDMSDGLVLSLHDLARASCVGFKICEEKLPVSTEIERLLKGDRLTETILYTGGDFELLFTVTPGEIETVKRSCSFSIIGEVIKDGIFLEKDGRLRNLEAKGYEHFKDQQRK